MGEVVAVISRPVEPDGVNIAVCAAVGRGGDCYFVAVFEMQHNVAEGRCAEYVLVCSGAYGIESESREHIPCRGLSVVFVAAISVGGCEIHLVHDLAHPVLGFPWLA